MSIDITKTVSTQTVGKLIPRPDLSLDLTAGNCRFIRGYEFEGQTDGGNIAISEIAALLTPEETAAVKKFIRIGTAKAAINAIGMDEELTEADFDNEF